jgi:hypothetical protein
MAENNELSFNIKVGGNQDQALGSLKKQLREAQQDVQALSDKFGATSEQAVNAAKRAAELKDRIGDAKSLTDAFNPDAKFKALTASLSGVAGGFAAAQGAIGLFGAESENVEKALLKVQSAMALSQGLQAVGESIDSFKQLGATIKNTSVFQAAYNFVMGEKVAIQEADVATTVAATVATKAQAAATNTATVATTASSTAMKVLRGAILATGIGALVIALGLVIANFGKIKTAILNAVPSLGKFASTVGNVINSFTDLIGVTNAATRAEAARQATYTKAAAGTKIVNEGIERQIKLLSAQGAEQGKIDELKKQSIQNELNDLKKAANEKGVLFGEQAKKYKDLQNELQVIDATSQAKLLEDRKKSSTDYNKQIDAEAKARKDKAIADEKQLQDDIDKARADRQKLSRQDNLITQGQLAKDKKEEEDKAKEEQEKKDNERIEAQKKVMATTTNYTLQSIKTQEEASKTSLKIDKLTAEQKIALAQQSADALMAVSGVLGKETAAGKALAVSAALINTYLGISAGVKLGFPAAIPAVAIAAATGFSAVKNIIATKVPGAGSGGAGNMATPNLNAAAPIAPPQPQAATTNISSQSINALGNQAIRSYVVESDVTSNQQRIAAIQQRARFG